MSSVPLTVLTESEAAERLGVTPYWLAAQARLGKVPHVRLGRYRKYSEEHIEQIVAACTVTPGQTLGRSARSRKGRAA